jgi:hypothetical protein
MHTLICCHDDFRVQFGYNLSRLYSILYKKEHQKLENYIEEDVMVPVPLI